MIFILSWILLRKKSGDQARCFISCACPEPPASLDFSFRARAGSRRRKQPLFFLRYMWRTRRVITQWNFPRTVQFPWRTLYLFFSLSFFFVFLFAPFSFFFWSIFFWDFPQSETSTSNPFIFVAWSSMLRRERNRISLKIQENSSSWTPRLFGR